MTYSYARMYEELTKTHDEIFNLIIEGTKTGEIGQKLRDALRAVEAAQDAIRKEAGE